MRTVFIYIVLIVTLFDSCFRETYRTLKKADISKIGSYEVKSMAGCCGCKAILYNVYRDKKLVEQFVVETSCGLYQPTKNIFSFDIKGNIVGYKSYVAVTDDSFTIASTELDQKAFVTLDSIYKDWTAVNKRQIVFSDIRGFKEGQQVHMPLGVKIKSEGSK